MLIMSRKETKVRNSAMINLDAKDRKILAELDSNSRQSFQEIARKVGLSKEAVFHRIKALEQKKIITGYTLLVSLAKLGFMQVKLMIKLQNITQNIKDEMILYLKNHKKVQWLASCVGNYDLLIGFVVKNLEEFYKIKNEISNKYSNYFLNEEVSIMIEGKAHGRKYLGKSAQTQHYIGEKENIEIKKKDYEILRLLSKNARMSVVEIAQKLNLTPRIVAYKIKQFEKKKIVVGYLISINHEKLGISYFKSFIYLRKTNNEIINFLENQKNCVYNVLALASWNLEPEFEVYSNEEFYKVVDEIQDLFGKDIKNINNVLITREHKFDTFPSL